MGAPLEQYNKEHGESANLTPFDFGAKHWGDVEAIKKHQKKLQVPQDGFIGPRTIQAHKLAVALDNAGLKIDRESFVFQENVSRRLNPNYPISIVWHDTITRTAKDCFNVLNKRGLSTHFIIPESGDEPIYQCADPCGNFCLHAGAFNQESIGVDVVCLLSPSYLTPFRLSDIERSKRIFKRSWSADPSKEVILYTDSQRSRILTLATALHTFFDIPKVIPYQLTGYGEKVDGIVDTLYHGSIAHAQWSSTRWDGLQTVEILSTNGWSEAKV